MQTVRLLLTFAGMVAPNIMIMRAMGWTSSVHFVLVGGCGLVATVLIVLIPERHRRSELRPRAAVPALVGWVFLSAVLFGTGWDMRAVLAALLVLPGLNYLFLEAIGLPPRPVWRGAHLP